MEKVNDTLEYLFDIVKQNNMVTVDKYGFFDLFIVKPTRNPDYFSRGGVAKQDDGISRPVIAVHVINLITEEEYMEEVEILGRDSPDPHVRRIYDAYKHGKILFAEYDEFHEDPEIGDYVCKDMNEFRSCLMTHEMAHCLQEWNCEPGYDEEGVHDGHNDVWKKDYRILRREMGLTRR